MNIDCCKSYVGKQIIGLIPSGEIPPIPPDSCLYIGFFDLNLEPYDTMFFDSACTQPLFTNNIGDGALRSLMQSNGGELYFPYYNGSSFVFQGCNLFYYGTSVIPIDIYSNLFGYVTSVYWYKNSDVGNPCRELSCFTATIESAFDKLANMKYYNIADIYLPNNPPYNSMIDVTDITSMTLFFKETLGADIVYTYNDNGDGTYTITITNAIKYSNYGFEPELRFFDGVSFVDIVMNVC